MHLAYGKKQIEKTIHTRSLTFKHLPSFPLEQCHFFLVPLFHKVPYSGADKNGAFAVLYSSGEFK